jgi:hypothetical protein
MESLIDKAFVRKNRIGMGAYGAALLVTDKAGHKYVTKMAVVPKEEKKESTRVPAWREIVFGREFACQHPDLFACVHATKLIRGCRLFKPTSPEAPTCIASLWDYKGETLEQWFGHTSDVAKRLSLTCQIAIAIDMMHKAGYTHNDLAFRNICVGPTDRTTVSAFGLDVPTFGNQLSFIDYGMVLSDRFDLTDEEKERHHNNTDTQILIAMIIRYGLSAWAREHDIELLPLADAVSAFKRSRIWPEYAALNITPSQSFFLALFEHPDVIEPIALRGKHVEGGTGWSTYVPKEEIRPLFLVLNDMSAFCKRIMACMPSASELDAQRRGSTRKK